MKKLDFVWAAALLAIAAILIIPVSHEAFVNATNAHPYVMGFVKVGILASMGELLALRIIAGAWKKPVGMLYRFIVWGLFGIAFAIVFKIFSGGVLFVMSKGLLPTVEGELTSKVLTAFFTSAFMNLIFAPTFMSLHRVTDTYIDLGNGKISSIFKVKLKDVSDKIDWYGFLSFVVLKTIPIFWIPAHTITFMLDPVYQVLMASFLSIALGGILAFAKKKAAKTA